MIVMQNTGNRTDGEIFCDGTSDVANLPQYAIDHNLQPGTTCLVIDTAEVYALKSDGTWKKL